MRTTLRLALGLVAAIVSIAYLFAYFEVRSEKQRMRDQIEQRAQVVAESMEESITALLPERRSRELQLLTDRLAAHLPGVAVYDEKGKPLAVSSRLRARLTDAPGVVGAALLENAAHGQFIQLNKVPLYVYAVPLNRDGMVVGALAVYYDAASVNAQGMELWRQAIFRALVQLLFVLLVVFLIVQWSVMRPIAKTAEWLHELRLGKASQGSPSFIQEDLLRPLTQEVTHIVKSLESARAAAEEEARLRDAAESTWTSERLHVHVQGRLQNSALLVVSNREPYMHVQHGKTTEVVVPASGLVTALEPILRATDGIWIAHGAGNGDRDAVDEHDRLRVPPEEPHYTLRRVWLTKEEEEGYYYGFANEGLWALCHIAHTRPTFRASDWKFYQEVNRKFADAVLEEMEGVTGHPALLVQDYHFALVPRMVKEQRPDARLAVFWHIPWPNPQAFGICPWQRDLLDGMLGADLLGFHTQSHCNYFLETVDQVLESRVDWERFSVARRGHVTQVRPFPISVAMPEPTPQAPPAGSVYQTRRMLFKALGVEATFMGVGVDRVDYTKGIVERFRGVERFLEKYPSYQGQFTLVQIGAPSRTHIKRYQDLQGEVESEAERINWRFQTAAWKPIVYLHRHHNHQEIDQYFKAADVCLVTSLHDGMNLVAKEFVAAREDEQGALILSRFTGASRELRDAIVVNPYDTEQLADALRFALEMDPEDRRARMQRMRRTVREYNVYRWAADLISELSDIRIEPRPEAVRR